MITGSLEGQHYRKTGRLVALSEQNLIDCTHSYGKPSKSGMSCMKLFVRVNGGLSIVCNFFVCFFARSHIVGLAVGARCSPI